MDDVSKSFAFTDPISAVFELNEDLMRRVARFMFLLEYAHMGGAVVSLVCVFALLIGYLTTWPFQDLIFIGMALGASLSAWWIGRQEVRFLEEYRLRSAALGRAKNWEPHPSVPSGSDPLDRFLVYLQQQDDRFAQIYAKKPEKLVKNAEKTGESGKSYRFDAFFYGWVFSWRIEPVAVFIRLVPTARIEDVQAMKAAVEDVLAASKYEGPVRAFLVQTQSGQISEDVLLQANEHPLEYERAVSGKALDWSSPVEVLAEDPSGVYNIGSFYFG
jgi:hypothetical protein